MSFLYSSFLWALLLVAVPIVIHLFNFRRYKKIYFPNLRFLEQVTATTQSRTRLRKLLILLFRSLFVICLVLAFAYPFLKDKLQPYKRSYNVAIYLDNSYSMMRTNSKGTLLDQAKAAAADYINSLPSDAAIYVLDNSLQASQSQRFSSADAVRKVAAIDYSPLTADYPKVVERASNIMRSTQDDKQLLLITDLQRTSSLPEFSADTTLSISYYPLSSEQEKELYIDSISVSAEVLKSGSTYALLVYLANGSTSAVENVAVRLNLNGGQVAVQNVNVGGESVAVVELPFSVSSTGWIQGNIEVDAATSVDVMPYYWTTYVPDELPILLVGDEQALSYQSTLRILKTEPVFKIYSASVSEAAALQLPKYSAVVLAGTNLLSGGLLTRLTSYVKGGGNILLLPDGKLANALSSIHPNIRVNPNAVNQLLQIEEKGLAHPFFSGVYDKSKGNLIMPTISSYYSANVSKDETVLTFTNGAPALVSASIGEGRVTSFTFNPAPPNANLLEHHLMLSTVFRSILYKPVPTALSYEVKQGVRLASPSGATVTAKEVLALQKEDFSVVPQQSQGGFYITEPPTQAGYYSLVADGRDTLALYAFNPAKEEKKAGYYSQQDIEKSAASTLLLDQDTALAEAGFGEAWKLFIILAAIFLLLESLCHYILK